MSATDTTAQHGSHLFDMNCKICSGKTDELTESLRNRPYKPTVRDEYQSNSRSTSSSLAPGFSFYSQEPQEESKPLKPIPIIKSSGTNIEPNEEDKRFHEKLEKMRLETDRLFEEKNQEDTPVVVDQSTSEAESKPIIQKTVTHDDYEPLWRGSVYLQDNTANFLANAFLVSGDGEGLDEDLPDSLALCGRISPYQVHDYVKQLKTRRSNKVINIHKLFCACLIAVCLTCS